MRRFLHQEDKHTADHRPIIYCSQHREALSCAGVLLVGVVEARVALGRQGADLLPVGNQLVLLQVDLGGVLGVRLLQTLHVSAQRVHLSHRQRRRAECETSGGSRMKVLEVSALTASSRRLI